MATTISASLVKELRDQSGAGMMDCKRALEETNGDLEAAQKLLREKGVAQAAKRSGRETTEGVVVFDITSESVAAMVAIGCETEPVSKNDEFKVFAYRALEAVKDDGVGAIRTSKTSASSSSRSSARTSPSQGLFATRARSTSC